MASPTHRLLRRPIFLLLLGAVSAGSLAVGEDGQGFCNGDGSDRMGCTLCPCGNDAAPGTVGGCLNSSGHSARLEAIDLEGIFSHGSGFLFELTGATPLTFAVLTSGDAQLPANPTSPCFGMNSGVQSSVLDGLRCVGGSVLRHGAAATGSNGDIYGSFLNGWVVESPFATGQIVYFQAFYRDDQTLMCGTGQNTSNGVSVIWPPPDCGPACNP